MTWYKRDKMDKFFRHWEHRKGLETLKKLHLLRFGKNPSEAERTEMAEEISQYIKSCYDHEEKV